MKRRCPVCRQVVVPTLHRFIIGHTDTIGELCPASGEPYRITQLDFGRPTRRKAA